MSELSLVIQRYIDMYPALRSKPIGSPGSVERNRQKDQIELEAQAKSAIESDKSAVMRELLERIAYPSRGSADEAMDIYAAAKLIQNKFSLAELRGVE